MSSSIEIKEKDKHSFFQESIWVFFSVMFHKFLYTKKIKEILKIMLIIVHSPSGTLGDGMFGEL